jgi:hypothetical protein
VSVVKALAGGMDVELATEYAAMTRDPREGDLLPGHLVGQLGNPEDH